MNSSFRWRRTWSVTRKEIFHITRDPFTLTLALIFPLFVVTIFGLAIEFHLRDIPTVFLDFDQSQSSRQLLETFGSSQYFKMNAVKSPTQGMEFLESEKARAFLVIPPSLTKNKNASVQILIDATDNSSASSILGYLGDIQQRTIRKIFVDSQFLSPPIQLKTRYLFNPELNSRWFIVPGLVVVIMSILSILLTALTIAREWESGSMELLLSTPIHPLEVVLGKLLPYAALGMIGVGLVYLLARLFFGLPFRGNHGIFLLGCLLFLITYLAQGLLISVVTRKQMLAMQLAMLSGLLPSQLLSGFIFPIESMPPFFQFFTMILPARWFMIISRDSFLQGSSFWDLRLPFLALTIIALLFIFLSIKRFKKDLEP